MSPRKRKKCRFQVEMLERRIALSYLLEGGPAAPAIVAPKSGEASTARPTLRLGSQGEDVRSLQESLGRLGYNLGSHEHNGVDGKFGPDTERAVEHFQTDAVSGVFGEKFNVGPHGPDGIVGSGTWGALEQAVQQVRERQRDGREAPRVGPRRDGWPRCPVRPRRGPRDWAQEEHPPRSRPSGRAARARM